MNQDNGGIIGKINTSTTTVASGVWTLQDQFEAQTSSIWPLAFPQITFANSCRFNDDSSDYLIRGLTATGNQKKWTWSAWVKISTLSGDKFLWSTNNSDDGGGNYTSIQLENNAFRFYNYSGGAFENQITTTRLCRDVSAWYHLMVVYDSANATADDRVKIYINGSQETSFAVRSNPSLNQNSYVQNTYDMYIGTQTGTESYFDGYMTEVIFVNDATLDPTSFGVFNTVSNIWEPRGYAGTYGTNGFRLDFANSSALGNDVSGNDNDFTVNNLTSIDQSTDTCSNNFATYNPLQVQVGTANEPVFREGNLQIHGSTTGGILFHAPSTIGVNQGKWYVEFKSTSSSFENGLVGVTFDPSEDARNDHYPGRADHSYGYSVNGKKYNNNSNSTYGNTYTANDIIGVALDLDNHKLYFSKNGTFQNSGDPTSGSTGTGSAFDLTTGQTYFFCTGDGDSTYVNGFDANFGSPPYSISSGNADANGFGNFEYAVPSGYFSLCTKNLAEFG
jgi:hypothetical protein